METPQRNRATAGMIAVHRRSQMTMEAAMEMETEAHRRSRVTMEAAMEIETEAHRRSQMITATAKEGIQMCQKNQTTVEIAIMHQKIMTVLQRNHPMMDRAQVNPMEMHSKCQVK